MAVLNVSFLNPEVRKSKGTKNLSIFFDQLTIKENQLKVDGNLSEADYDSLIVDTQQLLSMPGMSKSDRANINVKLSQYNTAKQTKKLDKVNDIERLNREIEDDYRKIGMMFSNSPGNFLQSRADVIQAKLERLTDSITNLESSGADASPHINEFTGALSEYNNMLQALEDVSNYKPGAGKPGSSFIAYVTTNSRGEIQDVNVGRVGSKTGYAETNGIYGGMQIYGKVNRKENGKNIFLLGNEMFSGSDLVVQDLSVPGSFRSAPLLSQDALGGKNLGVVIEKYKDVDVQNLKPQGSIRTGDWAEGQNGVLYNRLPNGRYVKYINADKQRLNLKDNDILRVPSTFESSINSQVESVTDGAESGFVPTGAGAFGVPLSPSFLQQQQESAGIEPGPSSQAPQQTPGFARTPQPTERAPGSAPGIAQRTIEGAKGLLSRLFGT